MPLPLLAAPIIIGIHVATPAVTTFVRKAFASLIGGGEVLVDLHEVAAVDLRAQRESDDPQNPQLVEKSTPD